MNLPEYLQAIEDVHAIHRKRVTEATMLLKEQLEEARAEFFGSMTIPTAEIEVEDKEPKRKSDQEWRRLT